MREGRSGMGVKLTDIVQGVPIELKSMAGRVIAIDALNTLYQFLAIIRQPDGELLRDSQGRITSHLSGLFYRTINLLEEGVRPVYVFDGKPPELKGRTLHRREEVKREARAEYRQAVSEGREGDAKKFAGRSIYINEEMLTQSKTLLSFMGIPSVQAPSEGEAQASHMAARGDCYAAGSQDFDSLLFGAPRLLRNITISGRRKLPGRNVYTEVQPELIVLEDVLREHKITREQLVEVGILCGTDFNEGVSGIGPKKALKIVSEGKFPNYRMEEYKEVFLTPPVTDDFRMHFENPNPEKVTEFLCEEHEFSESRVEKALQRLAFSAEGKRQTSLDSFL